MLLVSTMRSISARIWLYRAVAASSRLTAGTRRARSASTCCAMASSGSCSALARRSCSEVSCERERSARRKIPARLPAPSARRSLRQVLLRLYEIGLRLRQLALLRLAARCPEREVLLVDEPLEIARRRLPETCAPSIWRISVKASPLNAGRSCLPWGLHRTESRPIRSPGLSFAFVGWPCDDRRAPARPPLFPLLWCPRRHLLAYVPISPWANPGTSWRCGKRRRHD